MQLHWEIASRDKEICPDLLERYDIGVLLKTTLQARGITSESALKEIFETNLENLHDPFSIIDMEKATNRILKAVKHKEKITIYGDYDVDGLTSIFILKKWLKSKGIFANHYIPSRDNEGYGLNNEALANIAKDGTTLIITVDSGITAVEEIKFAKLLGIDIVVTDHHEPGPELPQCSAVINPKRHDCPYPFKELAGVGVVFKLLSALEGNTKEIFFEYGDMIALGTVADVMSVLGENRIIISHGLEILENTKNLGLRALKTAVDYGKIDIEGIAFRLAPRLNAAGRMSTADEALALLEATDKTEAFALASRLGELNKARQTHEAEILKEAESLICDQHINLDDKSIIILRGLGWKHGVLGIVASKLAERHNLPALVLTEEGEMLKGSARSIQGCNIYRAVYRACEGIGECGGHTFAAGVKLPTEQYELFAERLQDIIKEEWKCEPEQKLDLEGVIRSENISCENIKDLMRLGPFGEGNNVPCFALLDLTVTDLIPVANGKHTKFILSYDGKSLTGMFFGKQSSEFDFLINDNVDVAFTLEINTFRGFESAQLTIKDIRPSKNALFRRQTASIDLERLIAPGEQASKPIPDKSLEKIADRKTLEFVWKMLNSKHGKTITPALLYKELKVHGCDCCELGLLIALRAFFEAELLEYFPEIPFTFDSKFFVSLKKHNGTKVDIYSTRIMKTVLRRVSAIGT